MAGPMAILAMQAFILQGTKSPSHSFWPRLGTSRSIVPYFTIRQGPEHRSPFSFGFLNLKFETPLTEQPPQGGARRVLRWPETDLVCAASAASETPTKMSPLGKEVFLPN
jgi:hypothetical protein